MIFAPAHRVPGMTVPSSSKVLNAIRYLRVLDMPLTQIAEFLHNGDVHVIEDKLVAQKALIERKQHELEMVPRKIDHRLERLAGR